MQPDLKSWFEQRMGAYLLHQERTLLSQVLPTVFGYYMAQTGVWGPPGELMQSSAIRTRFIVDPQCEAGVQLCAHPDNLPLAGDSVDALLLPHTLEYSADPTRVLREAERVLVGEGHIIILGFHPWGPWALRRFFKSNAPWKGSYVRAGRLKEWLRVLGFETVDVRHCLFRPAFTRRALTHAAFLERLHWRLTASAYMLVARKRVFGVTPLRLKRVKPRRAFAGIVNPTAR